MILLVGAILAELAAARLFLRTRKSIGVVLRLRRARSAAFGEWPEPVILSTGLFNVECGLYTAYLIVVETAALPGVVLYDIRCPVRVLEVGAFFLVMAFCLYRAARGFEAEEQERQAGGQITA